jgi:hypothetical protein
VKAQISVEFFLVASFAVVLTIMIYQSNAGLYSSTRLLDDAYLAKTSLDRLSKASDEAWLQGNASRRSLAVFLPSSVNCLYFEAGELFCLMPPDYAEPPENRLASRTRAPVFVDCGRPVSAGWVFASLENNSSNVVLTC